ncbi:MAG: PQQ-binding-like beta-propeller repeat protein, partial [Acidobacteria bacterium]|nr:PQQ-binding-like beta-propeller repeat protein [Acidobacteriota bacterium]
MKHAARSLCLLVFLSSALIAQPVWQAGLDSKIRFYHATDFELVLTATEKSLYAIDAQTGEQVWRRKTGKIQETAVTPVPGTDLVLCTEDLGSKSRLTAVDLMTGNELWESDKVKGDVMQMAVDPEQDIAAIVLVKNARGGIGGLKRRPVIHVLALSTGEELWHRDLDSDIEMMPARFVESGDVDYTLD